MKLMVMMSLMVFSTTPAFAVFTEDFETNPFGITGDWSRSDDVIWTGNHSGNDYVALGHLLSNDYSKVWRSFEVSQTGQYCVSFDYRFIGWDGNRRADDTVTAMIGISREPLFDIFDATSSADLTGGLLCPGDWQTAGAPPPIITLEAGQTYWLLFKLQEATSCLLPVTSLHLDNIGVELCSTSVPAPGAVLLGSIGVALTGWLRTRRVL